MPANLILCWVLATIQYRHRVAVINLYDAAGENLR